MATMHESDVIQYVGSQSAGLLDLPNELLMQVLTSFSTRLLLPWAGVSRRFHDLILRIIHGRLLRAASMKEHKLILECFHPSAKYTEPYLFCDYLGTPGLSDDTEGQGSFYVTTTETGQFGKLGALYSRFRPVKPDAERKIVRPHPAGDVPGHPSTSTIFPDRPEPQSNGETELVTHTVSLDAEELFTQRCAALNLVKIGPRRGVFLSCVNVVEAVTRIWRDWLKERASASERNKALLENAFRKHSETINEGTIVATAGAVGDSDERLLWIGKGQNVAIRVRVKGGKWRQNAPLLLYKDVYPAVSYSMEYEELLVRTTHLLLAVEQSLFEQNNTSDKAMIFGSFATHNAE
ncbi:F-box domain [Lasallia pustulata]|uniref:F-box domain n=1 Tax=Lasallia pustulata TaxID=136370 RepID=A0A1W5CSD7_9LECA|nr:F-box domain [Lasallia pustulata]